MEEFFSLLNEDVLVKFLLLFARVLSFVAFSFYLVIFLFPFIGDIKYIN